MTSTHISYRLSRLLTFFGRCMVMEMQFLSLWGVLGWKLNHHSIPCPIFTRSLLKLFGYLLPFKSYFSEIWLAFGIRVKSVFWGGRVRSRLRNRPMIKFKSSEGNYIGPSTRLMKYRSWKTFWRALCREANSGKFGIFHTPAKQPH